MTPAERIARYAYRYWRRSNMERWPTVAQAAHALHMRRIEIEEEAGELYGLEAAFTYPVPSLGEHQIYGLTRDVDVAWCAYWRRFSPCYCGEHK